MFHMSGGIENSAGDKYSSISGGEFFKCEERTDGKDIVKTVCSPIDHDAYFNFHQGIVIGEWNPTCTYGAGIFSVDGVSDDHSPNCPQGNGTVTLESNNIASGLYSSVLGGDSNHAAGEWSLISGGQNNTATVPYSSIGGDSLFECEERTDQDANLRIACSPINPDTYFNFQQGIVIGEWNEICDYGAGIFSVGPSDVDTGNCPQGNGTVTFGYNNQASGLSSSVTGMLNCSNFAINYMQSFAESERHL